MFSNPNDGVWTRGRKCESLFLYRSWVKRTSYHIMASQSGERRQPLSGIGRFGIKKTCGARSDFRLIMLHIIIGYHMYRVKTVQCEKKHPNAMLPNTLLPPPQNRTRIKLPTPQIILNPMLISLLTRRRYASRNRMRSTVPTPTITTNKSAHTPVMMKPTGKMPRVLPGSTKAWFCTAAPEGVGGEVDDDDEDDALVWSSAKAPCTKDASLEDTVVVTAWPSWSVPERVMVGTRRSRAEAL